jgi:hypothetical protein
MVCRQYTLYSSVIEELHKLYDKTSVTQRHTRVRILSEVVAYYNFNSYTSIFTNPKWFIQCSTPRPKQYPNKSNTNVPSVHHHPHPIMEQATVVETAVVAVMVEAVVANNT